MTGIERQYPYVPKWWVVVLGILLCGFAAVYAKGQAQEDGVVQILGLFTLSPQHSTIFYLVEAGICVLALFLIGFFGIKSYATPRRVALHYSTMLVPKNPLSWEEVTVEYRNILKVTSVRLHLWRMLEIKHTGGRLRLLELFLGRKAFKEIIVLLGEKMQENARSPHASR